MGPRKVRVGKPTNRKLHRIAVAFVKFCGEWLLARSQLEYYRSLSYTPLYESTRFPRDGEGMNVGLDRFQSGQGVRGTAKFQLVGMLDEVPESFFVRSEIVADEQGNDTNGWLVFKSEPDPRSWVSLPIRPDDLDVMSQLPMLKVELNVPLHVWALRRGSVRHLEQCALPELSSTREPAALVDAVEVQIRTGTWWAATGSTARTACPVLDWYLRSGRTPGSIAVSVVVPQQRRESAVHSTVLKIAGSMSGVMASSFLAGVIYLVIALATGAPTVAAIIGGTVVTAIAASIALFVRTVYERRTVGSHPR